MNGFLVLVHQLNKHTGCTPRSLCHIVATSYDLLSYFFVHLAADVKDVVDWIKFSHSSLHIFHPCRGISTTIHNLQWLCPVFLGNVILTFGDED